MEKINYTDLLKLNPNPTYAEKLNTVEWFEFSESIKERDGFKCQNCNEEPTIIKEGRHYRKLSDKELKDYQERYKSEIENLKNNIDELLFAFDSNKKMKVNEFLPQTALTQDFRYLNAHHTRYIKNHLPWDYKMEHLITWCHICHHEWHVANDTPIYLDENPDSEFYFREKCTKCSGVGYLFQYNHIEGGICFNCGGEGGFE